MKACIMRNIRNGKKGMKRGKLMKSFIRLLEELQMVDPSGFGTGFSMLLLMESEVWLGFLDLVGKGGMSFGGVLYWSSLLGLGIRKQPWVFDV